MASDMPVAGKYIGNELEYVGQVLATDKRSATIGNWNHHLEEMFADLIGVKYAVALNSGTSGLHSCLAAAGVGPGDEVISPALTVIMDSFATLFQGATPVYVDVDPDTFNLDLKDLERKVTAKTKAIIPVALYGLPPDMDPIMELARKHNLMVLEDNAQCVLGTYKGRVAGTFGHFSMFSLENSKHISVGEGGVVTCDDEELAQKLRKHAGIGYKNLTAKGGQIRLNEDVFQDPDYKRHDVVGFNYRMPEVCAAIAVAQLERVHEIVALRQQVAALYAEAIDGCEWLVPQAVPEGYTNTYWSYALRYEGEAARGIPWRTFRARYKELGGDGVYAAWSVPYLEPALRSLGLSEGHCHVAEDLQSKLMQFKTNYRDLELAKAKAAALKSTIQSF